MSVVDYLEREAWELVPPPAQNPDGQWLELILRMNQFTPMRGPRVDRSVYSPPISRQPSSLPEVVRQITWEAEDDRKRSREQLMSWPTVTIEHFEISDRDSWGNVDSALVKLEKRLGRFPFDLTTLPGLTWSTDELTRFVVGGYKRVPFTCNLVGAL
jgi:hypothetical protein